MACYKDHGLICFEFTEHSEQHAMAQVMMLKFDEAEGRLLLITTT